MRIVIRLTGWQSDRIQDAPAYTIWFSNMLKLENNLSVFEACSIHARDHDDYQIYGTAVPLCRPKMHCICFLW